VGLRFRSQAIVFQLVSVCPFADSTRALVLAFC
jgi:hypothetical protein